MTDQHRTPRRRRTVVLAAVIVALAVVVAVVIAVVAANGAARPAATASSSSSPSASVSASTAPTTDPVPSPSASATPTSAPSTAAPVTSPTPQPTRTAAISASAGTPIKKALTARVVRLEAVTGTANGPGEIGGPSVRFTIRITNTTGSTFSLADTVVNAYYGASSTPAVQLQSPGGKDFPASVADGATATGVFVFNIPKAARSAIEVTVDTSVQNPVIAFKGSGPTG